MQGLPQYLTPLTAALNLTDSWAASDLPQALNVTGNDINALVFFEKATFMIIPLSQGCILQGVLRLSVWKDDSSDFDACPVADLGSRKELKPRRLLLFASEALQISQTRRILRQRGHTSDRKAKQYRAPTPVRVDSTVWSSMCSLSRLSTVQ